MLTLVEHLVSSYLVSILIGGACVWPLANDWSLAQTGQLYEMARTASDMEYCFVRVQFAFLVHSHYWLSGGTRYTLTCKSDQRWNCGYTETTCLGQERGFKWTHSQEVTERQKVTVRNALFLEDTSFVSAHIRSADTSRGPPANQSLGE